MKIDFGAVKPLPKLKEGEYQMKITDWVTAEPQNPETRSKGKNLRIKLKLSDPMQEDAETGEIADFSNFQTSDQIFYMFDNPFALVPLLCAVKGVDSLEDLQALGEIDVEDKNEFLGEEVIARLVRTEDRKTGKVYLNPVSEAYSRLLF